MLYWACLVYLEHIKYSQKRAIPAFWFSWLAQLQQARSIRHNIENMMHLTQDCIKHLCCASTSFSCAEIGWTAEWKEVVACCINLLCMAKLQPQDGPTVTIIRKRKAKNQKQVKRVVVCNTSMTCQCLWSEPPISCSNPLARFYLLKLYTRAEILHIK